MIFWIKKSAKNVPGPQNRFYGPWNMKKLEIRFQNSKNVKKMEPVLLKSICRLQLHRDLGTPNRSQGPYDQLCPVYRGLKGHGF